MRIPLPRGVRVSRVQVLLHAAAAVPVGAGEHHGVQEDEAAEGAGQVRAQGADVYRTTGIRIRTS